MIGRDQAHLFGECKVEIEDTSVWAIASLIVNITIGTNVSPGMAAVYLLKLLIHTSPQKNRKSTNGYFFEVWVPLFAFVLFVLLCGASQIVHSAGRSIIAE